MLLATLPPQKILIVIVWLLITFENNVPVKLRLKPAKHEQ